MKQTVAIDNIQVSNNRVLIPFSSGLAHGWMEGPRLLNRGPIARPKWKIPMDVWRKSLVFLLTVFHEKKWEALVQWYRNDEGEWRMYVPLQSNSGSTVNSIEHDENTRMLDELAADGYTCVGSIHSHCDMTAFQSGTDAKDEFSNEDGFHVTIGKMSQSVLDVHCRSVCTIIDPEMKKPAERVQLPFYLEDFIEGVPDVSGLGFKISESIRADIIKYNLLGQDEFSEDELPELADYMTRVGQVEKKVYTQPIGAITWIHGVPHRWQGNTLTKLTVAEEDALRNQKQKKEEAATAWWIQKMREQEADTAEFEELDDDEKAALQSKVEPPDPDETADAINQQQRLYGVHF